MGSWAFQLLRAIRVTGLIASPNDGLPVLGVLLDRLLEWFLCGGFGRVALVFAGFAHQVSRGLPRRILVGFPNRAVRTNLGAGLNPIQRTPRKLPLPAEIERILN